MKSTGYSHEDKVTRMSSRIPAGFIVVLFASSSTVGVGRRNWFNYNSSTVLLVMILMDAPKSTKVLPMVTETIGFPGLAYFTILGVSEM
jgi:hypothetical protein